MEKLISKVVVFDNKLLVVISEPKISGWSAFYTILSPTPLCASVVNIQSCVDYDMSKHDVIKKLVIEEKMNILDAMRISKII